LVADEVHYAKNTKAQRTVELFGGVIHHPETETTPALRETVTPIPARRRVYLTGTPILNRPIELWPLLHSADPQGLGRNWRDYVTRYCAGHQEAVLIGRRRTKLVWNVTGASHLDDLQARLRSTLMVRRLKHDVLTELPAKRRQILELPAEAAAGEVAGELAAWRAQQDRLATLHAAAECAQRGDDPAAYRAAVAALRAGLTVAFAEMSVQRHATALAKVPLILEHVREAAEQSGKVVCFCHHKDVVAALQGCLAAAGVRCVCCTGDMGLAERQAAVDAFQQDPLVRVFLGTIMAAGVGLTLTASSHVIFAELDWVPGNMSQAEDRCHRIGQRGSVLVQHLVLEGSLDAEIARRLVEKQDLIDQALDHVGAAPPDPGRGMWGRLLDIVAPAAGPAEVSA
jgi:SWI/SNF-related matrix-associated actin-dependent regulator 1 of chromatin subfamily A